MEKGEIVETEKFSKKGQARPRFHFVHRSVTEGTVHRLPSGGQFTVAPSTGLVPGFVVDLSVPDLSAYSMRELQTLIWMLNEKSSGFMWFDEYDKDAYEVAWRTRLQIRAAAPLYAWSGGRGARAEIADNITFEAPSSNVQMSFISSVLTSIPLHEGGNSQEVAEMLIQQGMTRSILLDKLPVGAVTIYEHSDSSFVTANGRLTSEHQGLGLKCQVISKLGKDLDDAGKTLLVGMANSDTDTFDAVCRLRMPLVSRAYIAQFGSF